MESLNLSTSIFPHCSAVRSPSSIPTRTFSIPSSSSKIRYSTRAVSNGGDASRKNALNSNYVVPMDEKSFPSLIRPLEEILRDLHRRIPENIASSTTTSSSAVLIPWYHANRMLSFYAPGWCGEVRDVIFSENRSVTVVYRVTIRGTDGEAYRESSGTVSLTDASIEDPVSAAEELAFCRTCARFGLGLYLYHSE